MFALHEHNEMAAHRKWFSCISELWLLLSMYPQRKTKLQLMKDLSFVCASIQKEQTLIYLLKCLFDYFEGITLFSIPSPSLSSCVHTDRKENWNQNEGRKQGVTKVTTIKQKKQGGEDGYVQMDFALRSIILNFLASFLIILSLPAPL